MELVIIFVTFGAYTVECYLIPSAILLTIGGMWYVSKKKPYMGHFLLGIGFLIGLNAHFSAVFLPLISVIFFVLNRKWHVRGVLLYLVMVLIALFPLVLFDFRHGHLLLSNTQALFSESITAPIGFPARMFITGKAMLYVIGSVFTFSNEEALSLCLGMIIIIHTLWRAYEEKKENIVGMGVIGSIFFLVYWIGFSVYGRPIPQYYLIGLFPVILILVSEAMMRISINKRLLLCLALYGITQLIQGYQIVFHVDPNGLHSRQQVAAYITGAAAGRPVYLHKDMDLGWSSGFSYLLQYYGAKESQTSESGLPFWISFPASSFPLRPDFKAGDFAVGGPDTVSLIYQTKSVPLLETRYTTRVPRNWYTKTCPSGLSDIQIFSKSTQSCGISESGSITVSRITECIIQQDDKNLIQSSLARERVYKEEVQKTPDITYLIQKDTHCVKIIDAQSGWGDQFIKFLR